LIGTSYRGHGGRPTVHVVPVGSVTGDVDEVVPVDDVVEPPPPDGLTAVALVIAPGVFIDSPDPVTPGDVIMLVGPGDVVTERLPDASEDVLLIAADTMEDVLLLSADTMEFVDDARDEAGVFCVSSSEIPVLPSTEPVWTLAIGLQAIDVVLVKPGV
jgi:hypothetical protein